MTALLLPTHPVPTDGDGMNPLPPQPKQFLRIGRPPRLPRRVRIARRLRPFGVWIDRLDATVQVALLVGLVALPLMIRPAGDDSSWHRPATPEDALIHEIDQAQLRDQLSSSAATVEHGSAADVHSPSSALVRALRGGLGRSAMGG